MFTTAHQSTAEVVIGEGSGQIVIGKKKSNWDTSGENILANDSKERRVADLLHESCKEGNVEVVSSLIRESRVNPNLRDKKGWSPILRATKAKQTDVLIFLIHAAADVAAQTRQGNTALHKACKGNSVVAAQALLDADADVNARNEGGATPLMLTVMCREGEDSMLKVLIKYNADIDAQKDVGYSALMIAARQNSIQRASVLLGAKANLEAKDKQGETAFMKAQKHSQVEMMELLKEHGAIEHERLPSHSHSQSHVSSFNHSRHEGHRHAQSYSRSSGGPRR